MITATTKNWKPGMPLAYFLPYGNNEVIAIKLDAAMLKADRSGQPLLLPAAMRLLDRVEATFSTQEKLTPGFIVSLREAMGLSQRKFAEKLDVNKMTVSRWECGRIESSNQTIQAILKLREKAIRQGMKIDGVKRTRRHPSSGHSVITAH